jgi:uncharacterized RDD family membrane protein YckC
VSKVIYTTEEGKNYMPASRWRRFVAFMLDHVVFCIAAVLFTKLVGMELGAGAALFGYYAVLESGYYGQSGGKRLMKIGVIHVQGKKIGFFISAMRYPIWSSFFGIVLALFYFPIVDTPELMAAWDGDTDMAIGLSAILATIVSIVFALVLPRKQQLHDFITGTRVVMPLPTQSEVQA